MDEQDAELTAIRAEIAAHLAWESELGGMGLPRTVYMPVSSSAPTPTAMAAAPIAKGPERDRDRDQAEPGLREVAYPDKRAHLTVLEAEVRACTRCELYKGRTQTVFARGNPDAALVFVGEGPGQEEDRQGMPFVGPAGQLLDKMIAAMGLNPTEDVYICNVVKCRPPNNRTPVTSEAQACESYLTGQIDAVAPRLIVALGRCAAENMGLVPQGGGWRGRWGRYRGIEVMPTYHPAFLLRSPEFKRPVWEDLQQVMAKLKAL